MKRCNDCEYAEWERTKSGKLHPNGSGKCKFPWKLPPLPASMYFIDHPHVYGGFIYRKEELKEHCPYYLRKE